MKKNLHNMFHGKFLGLDLKFLSFRQIGLIKTWKKIRSKWDEFQVDLGNLIFKIRWTTTWTKAKNQKVYIIKLFKKNINHN